MKLEGNEYNDIATAKSRGKEVKLYKPQIPALLGRMLGPAEPEESPPTHLPTPTDRPEAPQ
jgi:hypothetical protein